jgi:hypothetical protein
MNNLSISETEEKVKKIFGNHDWVTKESKRPKSDYYPAQHYISRLGHVKIEWSISNKTYATSYYNLYADLKIKTANGGWKCAPTNLVNGMYQSSYHNGNPDGIEKLIQYSSRFTAPVQVSKKTLPKAIVLGACPDYSYNKRFRNFTSNHLISGFRIDTVVGLEDNGVISNNKVYAPGEKVWFKCFITTNKGSTWNIITDGDSLHPLRAKGKRTYKPGAPNKGITFVVNGETHNDLKHFTLYDKELIHAAIEKFFNEEEEVE